MTTHLKRHAVLVAWLVAVPLLFSGCSGADERSAPDSGPATQSAQPEADIAKCAVHGAPKELCFICDASLREPGRLWCREHNRYEDRCWECHPELEDKNRLWCEEHSLYEDECFLCHPELLKEDPGTAAESTGAPAADEQAVAGLMCDEHRVPEAECGICHPELLGRPGLKVRLASSNSAAKAGVIVQTPEVQQMEDGVAGFAELTFNQNKLATITSLVGGVIKTVEVDLGSHVNQRDLLATITSGAIGEAEGAYLRAVADEELREKTFHRERDLLAQRISSEREYQEAEAAHRVSAAAVRQARQRLVVLGFDESQIQSLPAQGVSGVLELRAPFSGEIVERTAVQGAAVNEAGALFTLADTSVLWAMVNIPESQLSRVRTGQDVELTVESLPDRSFTGTLTWISATVDKRTRMARGRVEVGNTGGLLKAQMFARARISTARSDRAVVVPLAAVHHVAGTPIVFVRSSVDLYEARPVSLGVNHDGWIEIVAGLTPDEPVVVAGGFALKSQLLASRLGAGCVHE